jgi:hypothetical protein
VLPLVGQDSPNPTAGHCILSREPGRSALKIAHFFIRQP